MKYVIVLGDGMADYPLPELHGETPLDVADKPHMDYIAKNGICGLVKTIPDGIKPGSDTANLAVLGYNPATDYTGRSPLEAMSMGIDLKPDDVAMRCNLVTLSGADNYADAVMEDYSAGEITTEESTQLVRDIDKALMPEGVRLYPGISYRHCLVLSHAKTGTDCTPPHDISGRAVGGHLPKGVYGEMLLDIMRRSRDILKDHPVNKKRMAKGLNPANSCWFWGEGTRPALKPFYDIYGLRGAVVSAVDLVKGIGQCAGFDVINVPGATGNIDTNYGGKAEAGLNALRGGADFVYVHIEAPDECGHHGDIKEKIKAIEHIDHEIIGPMLEGLDEMGEDYSIMTLPDHPTPISTRTHASDPVPFAFMRRNGSDRNGSFEYSEREAKRVGFFLDSGEALLKLFLMK